MKKLIVIIALTITACAHPNVKKPIAAAPKQKQAKPCKYICVMDKDVCSDKPGVCPRCGMKLVVKEDNE